MLARRRFPFIPAHRFNHQLKSIAALTSKDPGQVSRWLRLETETYHASSDEASRIDAVAAALLRQQLESIGVQESA